MSDTTSISKVEDISKEVKEKLSNPEIANALLATTFKGLDVQKMAMALREGLIVGFTFEDFMKKDVYAVPFKDGYSLVTSIDYTRKVAMKNGLCGKTAPIYTYTMVGDKKQIESCTITVKRNVASVIGEYTATVFFTEYYAGCKNPDGTIKSTKWGPMRENLWDTKPHTMIAKVAEMHALRMAFPEDLSKQYVEEEVMKGDIITVVTELTDADRAKAISSLEEATTLAELTDNWVALTQKQREDAAVKQQMDILRDKFKAAEKATEEPTVQVEVQDTVQDETPETAPSGIKKRGAKKKIEDDGSVPTSQLPEELK